MRLTTGFGLSFIAICAAIIITGCERRDNPVPQADTKPSSDTPVVAAYDCPGEMTFTVRFKDDLAELFFKDQTIVLPETVAAGDKQYTDGTSTLSLHETEASLSLQNGQTYLCQESKARAVWEEAKLRGAVFRATGNEPGWVMEIMNSGEIILITSYGAERRTLQTPLRSTEPDRNLTLYKSSNHGQDIAIEIFAEPCQDTMNGDALPATVSITISGNSAHTFRGCGRQLI